MNCIRNYACVTLRISFSIYHTPTRLYSIQKTMSKVMNKTTGRKKSKYYEAAMPSSPTSFSKGLFEGNRSVNSKRANVLNKLFMRYITDLMAAGECSSYFVGHGIEVSRVQISPDFCSVNIYWVARGTEKDNVIEEILNSNVGVLRHELAQLKVVGVIPKLQFVKDKQFAVTAELDRLLTIADFGDDYVPVDVSTRLTTQLELHTALDPQTIDKIQSLEGTECCEESIEEPIPPMLHTIFNLNHSDIMGRIKLKKKVPQKITIDNNLEKLSTSLNKNIISFSNSQEEREAFRNFLNKRQILREKAAKLEKNYQPELEYLRDEWLRTQPRDDYDFSEMTNESDYIEEELERK